MQVTIHTHIGTRRNIDVETTSKIKRRFNVDITSCAGWVVFSFILLFLSFEGNDTGFCSKTSAHMSRKYELSK